MLILLYYPMILQKEHLKDFLSFLIRIVLRIYFIRLIQELFSGFIYNFSLETQFNFIKFFNIFLMINKK